MVQKQEKSRLADLLVEMRLVEEDVMIGALLEQRTSGKRLARVLADRRLVDEERLAKSVAAKLGLEAINLSGLKIHERVIALVPPAVAAKYGIIPIAIKRTNQAEMIYLVMCDPLDTEAIGEVQRLTGRQVRVLLGTATDVDQAIDDHYKRSAAAAAAGAPSPPRATGTPGRSSGLPPPAAKPQIQSSPPPLSPNLFTSPPAPRLAAAPPPAPATPTPSAKKGDSYIGPAPARGSASRPRPSSQTGNAPAGLPPAQKQRPAAATAAMAPLSAPLQSAEIPVLRGSPLPTGASIANDAYRPTLIDMPRPPELQNLFVAELQRPEPLGRAQRSPEPPKRPQNNDDLVFPSELDSGEGVRTRIDAPFDDDVERTLGPVPNRAAIDVEWDRAVKDWESQDAPQARDGLVVEGALAAPSGAADAPPRSDSDPVTTEAALSDISFDEPIEAVGTPFDFAMPELATIPPPVPKSAPAPAPARGSGVAPKPNTLDASRKMSFAALLAESGLPKAESEDIKTSQLELSEISAAELRRVESSRPRGNLGRSPPPIAAVSLDLPIDPGFGPSPFEGPDQADVPVGLERTGIIPAVDWDNNSFAPPPLPLATVGLEVRPLIAGDIPVSSDQVRLRSSDVEPSTDLKPEDIESIEEVSLDPLPESVERAPDSDSSDMPVIEPSSLASLMDDASAAHKQPDTGAEEAPLTMMPPVSTRLFDESNRDASPPPAKPRPFAKAGEEEPTNPRIEAGSMHGLLDATAPLTTGAFARAQRDAAASVLPPRHHKLPIPPPPSEQATHRPISLATEEPTPSQDAVDRDSVLHALDDAFFDTGRLETRKLPQAKEAAPAPTKEQAAPPPAPGPTLRDPLAAKEPAAPKEPAVTKEFPVAKDPAQKEPITHPAGRDPAKEEARALVAALKAGESLSSAERVQLVLALGRVLLKKGVLTDDELVDELG